MEVSNTVELEKNPIKNIFICRYIHKKTDNINNESVDISSTFKKLIKCPFGVYIASKGGILMDEYKSQHAIINKDLSRKNKEIVSLRPVVTRKTGKPQILKRRPIVINKNGQIIWQVEPDRYYYRDKLTNKRCSCFFSILGGVVIVYDRSGEIVEAYKLKEGEHVVTLLGA